MQFTPSYSWKNNMFSKKICTVAKNNIFLIFTFIFIPGSFCFADFETSKCDRHFSFCWTWKDWSHMLFRGFCIFFIKMSQIFKLWFLTNCSIFYTAILPSDLVWSCLSIAMMIDEFRYKTTDFKIEVAQNFLEIMLFFQL